MSDPKESGETSPAAVAGATLAALGTQDGLGLWLARNWGRLSDMPRDLLEQIDL